MDRWWGQDEDSYLDEDGKPISKEDYYKQFKGGMINPFDKDGNLLLPQHREPMEDDYMFQGRDRNQLDDWVENERRTTNPFYHLQGAGAEDDELARRMAEYLAPHISDGSGKLPMAFKTFSNLPNRENKRSEIRKH